MPHEEFLQHPHPWADPALAPGVGPPCPLWGVELAIKFNIMVSVRLGKGTAWRVRENCSCFAECTVVRMARQLFQSDVGCVAERRSLGFAGRVHTAGSAQAPTEG